MALSPLWPKPPRQPISLGNVHPNQRWLWHSRPKLILPLWEQAGPGTAQRYANIAGRGRRSWILNSNASAARTRYGPGLTFPTDNGAEIEAEDISDAPTTWAENEPYTVALLLKPTTGALHIWRSSALSSSDHILFFSTGLTLSYRHDNAGGTSTTITAGSALTSGAWHTVVQTWRGGRMALFIDGQMSAESTHANVATSLTFSVYRFGWGFSTSTDYIGEMGLIMAFGSCWTDSMVLRWHADPFGFLRQQPAAFSVTAPSAPADFGSPYPLMSQLQPFGVVLS